jgi:inhibitor of cysteine peptidase
MILTREQDGETVKLERGGEVLLSLPENPTTGYRWTFVTDGLDLVEDTYVGQAEGATGGGGKRQVRLVMTRVGAASVSATLQRSWEGTTQAVDRCAFHFNVS